MTVPRFVVMTSRAGPRGGRGNYRNVRVVETDCQEIPKMVSPRARHFVRVVRDLGAHYEGRTEACAYRRTLAEAEAMAAEMNKRSDAKDGVREAFAAKQRAYSERAAAKLNEGAV